MYYLLQTSILVKGLCVSAAEITPNLGSRHPTTHTHTHKHTPGRLFPRRAIDMGKDDQIFDSTCITSRRRSWALGKAP